MQKREETTSPEQPVVMAIPVYGPNPDVFSPLPTTKTKNPKSPDTVNSYEWECSNPLVFKGHAIDILGSTFLGMLLRVATDEELGALSSRTHALRITGSIYDKILSATEVQALNSSDRSRVLNHEDRSLIQVARVRAQVLRIDDFNSPSYRNLLRSFAPHTLPFILQLGPLWHLFAIPEHVTVTRQVSILGVDLIMRDAYPHEEGNEDLIRATEEEFGIIIQRPSKNSESQES